MYRKSWRYVPTILFFVIASIPLFAQNEPDALREYRNGNYQRAVSICTSEISANPNNLEAHVVMCWSLIRLHNYAEAQRYGIAGRNISRYDPRIVEILGETNYYQGHNAAALQLFQEYINLAPEGSRVDMVYYLMGEIFIREGKFNHADIALSTAVYYLPGNAEWWTRLAYARENAGSYQTALTAYEKALSLNSQLTDAEHGLERVRQNLR
jgi:tetratricopeptide (TPR) repeat protein